jgi:hypothetical protein
MPMPRTRQTVSYPRWLPLPQLVPDPLPLVGRPQITS